jgi:hypothetical protein
MSGDPFESVGNPPCSMAYVLAVCLATAASVIAMGMAASAHLFNKLHRGQS